MFAKTFEKIYKLHLHCDIVFYKRWSWRKHLGKGDIDTLEVGPGGGVWTLQMLKLGNSVTAVDIDKDSLNRLEHKLNMFGYCDPSRIKLVLVQDNLRGIETNERFDQIVLFEVLEHIKEDIAVIEKLTCLLKEGGRMLVSTPSVKYIPFYGDEIDTDGKGGHVRKGYSFDELKEIGHRMGLKVLFKDSCGGYFTRLAIIVERIIFDCLPNMPFKMCLNALLRPFTWLDIFYPRYPDYINLVVFFKPLRGEI